jgi:hypothetical protein
LFGWLRKSAANVWRHRTTIIGIFAAERKFGSELLSGISILTSVGLGEDLAGSVIVLSN